MVRCRVLGMVPGMVEVDVDVVDMVAGKVVRRMVHGAGQRREWVGPGVALWIDGVLCAGGESSRDSAGDDAPGTSS